METPASLYAVRVPSKKVPRRLNGTEMALAALVYSHARADHAVPVCTRPIAVVARMLGYTRGNIQEASRVLEAAGYWRRVRVGSVWRWEILILPSADGHRWADAAAARGTPIGAPPDQGEVPQSGDPPNGVPVPQTGDPQSGHGYPDQGVGRYPNRGTQHQQEIREEEASGGQAGSGTPTERDPRLVLADAINAQAEHAEAVGRANPPTRMGASTSASGEHQALRQRFQAALSKLEPGPERARLAACGLATPMPEVLRQASDELGGLERVADVLGWAWAEVAAGRLTSFGRAEASTALRDAFRGEGRYWRGILDAYSRRPGEQRALAWRPPDLGDLEPATLDELRMPDWRAAR